VRVKRRKNHNAITKTKNKGNHKRVIYHYIC
jgi:hypothetical protein